MPRLFKRTQTEIDSGSALFAMASLMMLLLPTLLLSTSTQKLSVLPLSIAGSSEDLPSDPGSTIKKISLQAEASGFQLLAWVRTTDVRAQGFEEKSWSIQDTQALHDVLLQLKSLDPEHKRIALKPLSDSKTEDVVRWMDVLSQDPSGKPLFPEIIIEPAQ